MKHKQRHQFQQGTGLIEVMVSLALGMLLMLAASALFVAEKGLHASYLASATMEENGRHALGLIRQAIRQAGYREWGEATEPDSASLGALSPDLGGLDHHGQGSAAGLERSGGAAVNHSDVLAVRFFGSGAGGAGDGSMADCMGQSVAPPNDLETDRGWSIFYVGVGSSGEPELRCKGRGADNWSSQPVVAGIEALQLLYGLDLDEDGLPERYLNASALDELDAAAGLVAPDSSDAQALLWRHQQTHWKKIVSVRIALVVRAAVNGDAESAGQTLYLFGQQYALEAGAEDPGTTLQVSTLPASERRRARKVFVATVMLHNHLRGAQT